MHDNKDQDTILTKDDLAKVREWLSQNKESIPPAEIKEALLLMLDLCVDAQNALKNNKKLVTLLRQYMGFIPTKERNGKSEETPETPWSKNIEEKLHSKVKSSLEEWKQYKAKKPKKVSKKLASEAAKATTPEPVFSSPTVQIKEEPKECAVKMEDKPAGMISPSSSYQNRERFDLSFCLTKIKYRVETISCPITGFSKTAKIEDGPARFRVTWDAISQIVMLVAGMGIPMVRLATTLQVAADYFSPTRIYRLCLYVAHALAAIYLELFRELASCDMLSGDDTGSSVLSMRRDEVPLTNEEKLEAVQNLQKSREEDNPQKANIILEVEAALGTQRMKKNGKELKKKAFTTVVIGERRSLGAKGTLVFYHTERKSYGDLLGKILEIRQQTIKSKKGGKPLVIQSDLSTQNIPNPYPVGMELLFVGCAAHARRPFWRFRKDVDPNVIHYCYTMLLLFDKIFDSDRDARETGDFHQVLHARKNEQAPLWEKIKIHCNEMKNEFAPTSDMGKAAAYISTNFEKLTQYLNDPRIRPDNNQAERLLRYEKIMHDNSKFRVTKRGRLTYDILRTILTTCSAGGINTMEYLVFVMKNQAEARKNPAKFTPYAYATSK
jgi:hypothetical protein